MNEKQPVATKQTNDATHQTHRKAGELALAAWRSELTKEQRADWIHKMVEGRMKAKKNAHGSVFAPRSVTGLRVSFMVIKNGCYQKGSSRTLYVNGVDWDIEQTRADVAEYLKRRKERGATRTQTTRALVI